MKKSDGKSDKLSLDKFEEIMAASGGPRGPPGFGGSSVGGGSIPYSGFGHVGTAGRCYTRMARVYLRAGEVRDNVENDQLNIKKYVKEIAAVMADLTKATGRLFEQEHMRMIIIVSAINPGGFAGRGGNGVTKRGIMEHKVITNLWRVNVDKSLFRQWHQRFITAVGQYGQVHEEIV